MFENVYEKVYKNSIFKPIVRILLNLLVYFF